MAISVDISRVNDDCSDKDNDIDNDATSVPAEVPVQVRARPLSRGISLSGSISMSGVITSPDLPPSPPPKKNSGSKEVSPKVSPSVSASPHTVDGETSASASPTANFNVSSASASASASAWASASASAAAYQDDGQPSYPVNCHADFLRVMDLIHHERHLAAHTLYLHTLQTIETHLKFTQVDNDDDDNDGNNGDASDESGSNSNSNSGNSDNNVGVQEERRRDPSNIQLAIQFMNIPKNAQIFQKLQQHAMIFLRAKRNASSDDTSWTPCLHHNGITSSYRREEDGSLSLKVEGEINGLPLFEQVAVMREVDLYHTWAPVCKKSRKICSLGKLDTVGWLEVNTPFFVRDSCYRAIGCDHLKEEGCVIVVAQGLSSTSMDIIDEEKEKLEVVVEDKTEQLLDNLDHEGWHWHQAEEYPDPIASGSGNSVASSIRTEDQHHLHHIHHTQNDHHHHDDDHDPNSYGNTNNYLAREAIMDTIELPPPPKGFNASRMDLKFFEAVIDVQSPTTARTRIVANIDPKVSFLPQGILDFIMKRMCGILLTCMQNAAKKATIKEDAPHALRMREDRAFYASWLMPRVKSYCNKMGWEMPTVFALKDLMIGMDLNRNMGGIKSGDGGGGGDIADLNPNSNHAIMNNEQVRTGLETGVDTVTSDHDQDRIYTNTNTTRITGTITPKRRKKKHRKNADGTMSISSKSSVLSKMSKVSRKVKKGIKKINPMNSSSSSVRSAPVMSKMAQERARKRQQSPFSEKQKERLEELKLMQIKSFESDNGDGGDDDDADGNDNGNGNGSTRSRSNIDDDVRKKNDFIFQLCEYSHPFTLSALLAAMLFTYHWTAFVLNHEYESISLPFVDSLRQLAILTTSLILCSSLHWVMIQVILVSAFDSIEMPVLKRYHDGSSSSTRAYLIEKMRLPTMALSGGIAVAAIVKNFVAFMLQQLLELVWMIQRVLTLSSHDDDASVVRSSYFMCSKILDDTKSMMTYSSVFVLICYLIVHTVYPAAAAAKSAETTTHSSKDFIQTGIPGEETTEEVSTNQIQESTISPDSPDPTSNFPIQIEGMERVNNDMGSLDPYSPPREYNTSRAFEKNNWRIRRRRRKKNEYDTSV
eukprot:CAMPEP_0194106706 /NCGR_PEP_ID=MMETSP0150-20130528/6688_1 /TAXON_ID=122233 /ORGANISM="Chaetoceros debilis, Strain MM31A-1" /LENGTH=1103 /DNA_ID=CAMNT_0038794923 /DNA_START=135 /DNA_END=3443 /DNA_ORIENTATION=-